MAPAFQPPRISGRTLSAVRVAAENQATVKALHKIVRASLRVDELATLPESFRGELAQHSKPWSARREHERRHAGLPLPTPRPWPRCSSSYADAYRAKKTTPLEVAERALRAMEELARRKPTMNLLAARDRAGTMRDAERATARWASGATLGPLDGVPFLIKDEFDVAGLPTTLGSRCEDLSPKLRDATIVARLRAAGGVFLGKTVLTEWGMSPIGGNTSSIAPMPHNAHDPTRAPGGSSSGSGVGVALGVAPIAAGGDGGGSIRIPASLNGVFGIKPTFGRVSRAGDGFKGSVAHAGPLAASTADLALFLDAVASERDLDDDLTDWAPAPPSGGFGALLGAGVKGLRIGVDEAEWRDASEAVQKAGRMALAELEKEGAVLVPLRLDVAPYAARIGYLTIGPESVAGNLHALHTQRQLIADDLRVMFAVLSEFSAVEQLDAQRLRTGLRAEMARVLKDVDVLALPTTAITAPKYDERDERSAFSDPVAIDGLCRYTFLANLTGLPAATAPVGIDGAGLPIGLQIVGDAWDEATVLAVLAHLERIGAAAARRPSGAIDLL